MFQPEHSLGQRCTQGTGDGSVNLRQWLFKDDDDDEEEEDDDYDHDKSNDGVDYDNLQSQAYRDTDQSKGGTWRIGDF